MRGRVGASETGGLGQLPADQGADLRLLSGGGGEVERAAGVVGMKQGLQLSGEVAGRAGILWASGVALVLLR